MMKSIESRLRKQSGVALLVALFALLLLSAIGMGMMFSANTETNVNANYREKQIATYAAIAGVAEAKDRLSAAGDITVPAGLPVAGTANVIYIINPSSGENVRPWLYSDTYADTELCHENVLGLTAAANGTWCSGSASLPSSGGWYSYRDNSASGYTGAYKLNPPLAYKWTRIQLKANNSTPYAVDGNAANATQVCWTGLNQIPVPTGYKNDCTPSGAITSIIVANGGSNYNTNPQVQLSSPGGGGTQAQASATIANPTGTIYSFQLDDGGAGYTYAPTVSITGGGGTGAAGTATVYAMGSGGAIQSLTRNDYGSPAIGCWTGATAPTVNLAFSVPSGGAGSGAAGIANLTSGYNCIAGISISAGTCNRHLNQNMNVTVNLGDNNFTGTIFVPNNGHISGSVNVTNPGTGYNAVNVGSSLGVSDPTTGDTGGCTGMSATATLGHTLTSVALTSAGAGYTMAPSVTFTPAPNAGNSPSITALPGAISPGNVATITLTASGSGYTGIPTVTLVGGCGTPSAPIACTRTATAHAVFPGVVTSVTITDPGSGYTSPPTVTFNGGGGSGATARAYIQGGTYYSPVYLLTSLGVSPGGARSMVQMEVAPAIRALNLPGALTLAGPTPNFGAPNSNNFQISGTDHPNGYIDPVSGATSPAPAGCTGTAQSRPAIGVYDDPNAPTSPSSVQTVLGDLPSTTATTNYPGLNASPDVQNVYGALGDQGTTPSGLNSIVSSITALPGTNSYGSGQTDSTIALGTPTAPVVDVINGDLTLSGSTQGYGVLVVTGDLTFRGNFTWNGIVLVIGTGNVYFSGGGGGTINGSVMVAKTKDSTGATLSTLGQPVLDWSGGGGNGIYYDHCWADSMLSLIPMTVPVSSKPLTILSVKTLAY